MGKIVFTLNNTGIHQLYISATLEIAFLMDIHDDPFFRSYCLQTGLDVEMLRNLHQQIVIKEPSQYPFTAPKMEVLYYAIFFLTKAFVSADCEKTLQTFFNENLPGFVEVRNKYLAFAGVELRRFSEDLKKVPEIQRAKRVIEKISL